MKIKKIAAILYLILFFVIADSFSVKAASNDLSRTRRSIAIVFDNSDSMVRDSGRKQEKSKYLKRWAQATYALRTFMHMVNEEDVVHLYTVDNGDSASDKGVVTKDDIDKAVSEMGVSYVTKMYGMRKAYHWANNQFNTEKWVVILTDGKFYKNKKNGRKLSAKESIGKFIDDYKGSGVNTICVGLGLERKAERELKSLDDGKYCSVFCTSKSKRNSLKENKEINENILKISKKIYTMERLGHGQIRNESNLVKDNAEFHIAENGTLTWKSDTEFSKYIQEIIIMAQVEGFTKEKDMSGNMEVIYSDRDFTWANGNDIKQFNRKALDYYGNYSYLIDRKLVKKINSSCYIQHYDKSDLDGNEIKFKLPKGKNRNDYTYQIYYILDTTFIPVLKKGKTEVIAENQKSFFTEGSYQVDYNVISPEGEKISKKLLAIRKVKDNIELKAGNKSVKPGNNKTFNYKDIQNPVQKKENQYMISVSYNKSILNNSYFIAEPDLKKYKLSFWKEKQDVNIDKENENKILLKLTGKNVENKIYYWLKNKINGKENLKTITYNFKNKDNVKASALGIQLKKAEIVKKKDFIKIGLPVEIVDSDEIKMDEHYQFSILLSNESDIKLAANNGDIQITQEEPEVFLKQTEITVIEKIKNKTRFDISAYVLGKKTDIEIVDAGLTLETKDKKKCLDFKFNKENGEIVCKVNMNIIKYFFSGIHNDKLSYDIHLKRNGKEYFQKQKDHELIDFQWKINHFIWIMIIIITILMAFILISLSILIRNGSLLFDEKMVKDSMMLKVFPIVWISPRGQELSVAYKIFKHCKTIEIFPCFNQELKASLEKKKIVLAGRKKGYYLKNFDDLNKLKGISVENKLLENTGDSIIIQLKNKDTDNKNKEPGGCFQLLYKNERKTRASRIILLVFVAVAVVLFIRFLFWLNL